MAEENEFKYAADALYTELRRTWPEELTKEELLASSGLSTEEARAGLSLLQEEGRLDESAGQLRAKVEDEMELSGPLEAAEPQEAGEEADAPAPSETPPPASPTVVPGAVETYHSRFEVMVAFGQSPGTKSEAVVKTAKAMEGEIADRIHKMYDGAVVAVELKKIEVSEPRVIYGGGDDGEA